MWYDNFEINPPLRSGRLANDTNRLAVSIEPWLVDTLTKEITMISAQEKKAMKDKMAREGYEQWQEMSKAHWNHWRAWGSWFSWGSPVGLGLFFVLLGVAFAVVKFAITL